MALIPVFACLVSCTSTRTDRSHDPMVVVPEETTAMTVAPVVVRPVSTYSIVARDGSVALVGAAFPRSAKSSRIATLRPTSGPNRSSSEVGSSTSSSPGVKTIEAEPTSMRLPGRR